MTPSALDDSLSRIAADLRTRRRELRARTQRAHDELTRERDLHGGFSDQVAQRFNDEVVEQTREAAEAEVAQIDVALERIAHGTYETCAQCGGRIPRERLEVVPYSEFCVDCSG